MTQLTKRTRNRKLEEWMLPVVQTAILEGLPLALVCNRIFVSAANFRLWYQEGSDPECKDELKLAFALAVDEARTDAAEQGIRLMRTHAETDFRAALALLKVSDPATWNVEQKVKVESSPSTGRNLSALSDEELLELAALENKMLTDGK